MPQFKLREPATLAEALQLLVQHGESALLIAGGTDLVPNLKHKLFEPEIVISLARIGALKGIESTAAGGFRIGAMTTLAEVAGHAGLSARYPALAQAASLVAGPQLRTMGTLGGNVMLDTRCQWYNQSYFWRKALGYCLKKDGTVCHVVAGGQKCVAAASNDTAPALMTLEARLHFHGPGGEREVPIDALWRADGIWNKVVARDEILTAVQLPPTPAGHRGAYGKLRERASIDFPLLGVAARVDLDEAEIIRAADVALVALAARPLHIKGVAEELCGKSAQSAECEAAILAVAARAQRQCHPLPNIPGDDEYRQAMIPVYVRRTLRAALAATGPVHAE